MMDKLSYYEIRVKDNITDHWSEWFEGMAIRNDQCGKTVLGGYFIDQAALLGVLNKMHALNLTLISVNLIE